MRVPLFADTIDYGLHHTRPEKKQLSPLRSPSGRVSSSVTQETARPRRFSKGNRLTFGSTDDIAFDPQFDTAHVTPEFDIPAVSNEADAFIVCAICA